MRKGVLLTLGLIIGLALLAAVLKTISPAEMLALLASIQPRLVLAYLVVSALIFLLLVVRWKIICAQHGIKAPVHRLFGYRMVGFAVSYITPGPKVGGEPLRAALLTKEDTEFPRALSSVIADKTIEMTSFGVMFIFALLIAIATLDVSTQVRSVLVLLTAMLVVLVLYGFSQMLQGKDPVLRTFRTLRLHRLPFLRKYHEELQEFEDNIHGFYGSDRRSFWKAQAVSAIAWMGSLLEFKILLLMLGIDASFVEVFLVYSVVGIAYLIPVPLALGTLEASQATLFAALGMSLAAGATLALITRSRDLIWTLLGFIVLSYHGFDIRRNGK